MKNLIIGLLLIFSAVALGKPYFPVFYTPEPLQLLYGGYKTNSGVTGGIELNVQGEKDRGLIERVLGDWSHFNHSFSVGVQGVNPLYLYSGAQVFLQGWDAIGMGVKQIIYYNKGLPAGSNILGETTLFAFYQLPNKSILWGDNNEYLNFYIGFKSEHSNFYKENIEDIVANAVDLYEMSKNITLGLYYNPNVLDGNVSLSLQANTQGNFYVLLFFNV